jgi:hypothetical protein
MAGPFESILDNLKARQRASRTAEKLKVKWQGLET